MKKFLLVCFLIISPVLILAQEKYELENGLTVILQNNNKVPMVTFQIWVKTGSIFEIGYPGAGISHFIEHLLFTDTKKHSGIGIAQLMKKYGCDMNGYTSFERTVFHYTLPSENLDKIIPLVKEMIFECKFDPAQIEKERNVILKEINMNIDDPDRFFSRLIFYSAYEQAFYKYPIIGYTDVFKKIKKEDIINYYRTRYTPDNIAVIVVGDFDSAAVKKKIDQYFGDLPKNVSESGMIFDEPEQIGYRETIRYRKDIKLTKMAMAWKTVDLRHKDLYALDVFSLLLSRGKNSILNSRLKEDLMLVNSISSYSYTPLKKGVFVIESQLNEGVTTDQVKEEILKIIKQADKYITADKIKKIKLIALREYYKDKETINSIAADLGINWASADNIYFSKKYVEGLRSVTREDILQVIKKYFYHDNCTFIAVLPEQNKIKTAAGAVLKTDTRIETFKLPNGLTLVLNENKELPFINLNLFFKGGVLFEPQDKKGLTYLLSKMLISGTKKLSRKQLVSLIEDNGGVIHSFSGNNSFGISLEIFKENLPKTMDLLQDILFNSAFKKKEMEKNRNEILQEIKANNEQIFGIGKKLLFKEMYPEYAYGYLYLGDEGTVKNIFLADLENYYKLICRPDNAVISCSGDFSLAEMKQKIKNKFSKWTGSDLPLKEMKYVIAKDRQTREVNKPIDKQQSLVLLAYYGISVRDEERIKVDLLWNVLNGQGSRIFTNLREKKELAYYTGMFPFYGLTTGLFVFYVGTVKDKLDLAKKGLQEEIADLLKNGITQKELDSAKKEYYAEKLKIFQSNSGIASDYGYDMLYLNKIISIKEYQEQLNSISLKQMNEFIKKYFAQTGKFIILNGQ